MKRRSFGNIPLLLLFCFLFLLSGAASLVYEVVWERLLQLFFGTTSISVTLIVAAYMGGLGFGSMIGSRISKTIKNLIRLYGIIEIGIGLFGIFSVWLIQWIGNQTAGINYVFVFLISFLVLLIPTTLMGMTLPLLTQAFLKKTENSGRIIGLLYGINTLGAAFGTLVSGYLLIGKFGLDGAVNIAVILNLAIGIIAILAGFISIYHAAEEPQVEAVSEGIKSVTWSYRAILISSFLVGFLGLGLEMLWIRALNLINKGTVYSFPTILFIYLLSFGVASYFWGKVSDRSKNLTGLFWKLELIGGIVAGVMFLIVFALIQTPDVSQWLQKAFFEFRQPASPWVEQKLWRSFLLRELIIYMIPMVILVVPPSIFLGGGLTLLDKIAIRPGIAGRRVGEIHLFNIIGSVLGTVVCSFIFLPNFGTEITLQIFIALSSVFLFIDLVNKKEKTFKKVVVPGILFALMIAVIIFIPKKGELYPKLFATANPGAKVVIHEGPDGILTMTSSTASHPKYLWIGGTPNSFYPATGSYEVSSLTCASASQPKRVLIIGVGGGNMLNFYSKIPGVEKIVVVELMSNLGKFLQDNVEFYPPLMEDPRISYFSDDGRRFLYANPDEKFDLISIDPFRNYTGGHNNLYSVEALNLYKEHLNPDGVVCQWRDEDKYILKTAVEVFPYADVFSTYAVLSNSPISYDANYFYQSGKKYMQENEGFHLDTPMREKLSMHYVVEHFWYDQDQVMIYLGNVPPLTDLTPRLEYYISNAPVMDQIDFSDSRYSDLIDRLENCDQACIDNINS